MRKQRGKLRIPIREKPGITGFRGINSGIAFRIKAGIGTGLTGTFKVGNITELCNPEGNNPFFPFLRYNFRNRGWKAKEPVPEDEGRDVGQAADHGHTDAEMAEKCDRFGPIVVTEPCRAGFCKPVTFHQRLNTVCCFRPDFTKIPCIK